MLRCRFSTPLIRGVGGRLGTFVHAAMFAVRGESCRSIDRLRTEAPPDGQFGR